MESQVIVALISSISAFFIALLGLLQSLKAAKSNTDIQIRLEKIKKEDARRKNAYTNAVAEAKPFEVILSHLWDNIQAIRDEISAVNDGVRESEMERKFVHAELDDFETLDLQLKQKYMNVYNRLLELLNIFIESYHSVGADLDEEGCIRVGPN
ncbi:hypothetical protein KA005_81490 [bacterium]|nr:hypothetical protein [bacterium]